MTSSFAPPTAPASCSTRRDSARSTRSRSGTTSQPPTSSWPDGWQPAGNPPPVSCRPAPWSSDTRPASCPAAGNESSGLTGLVCYFLLKPEIQQGLGGHSVRRSESSELFSQHSVHRKIERRRPDIELEFSGRRLVPVICEAMRNPVFAELFVRTAAGQRRLIFGHIAVFGPHHGHVSSGVKLVAGRGAQRQRARAPARPLCSSFAHSRAGLD